MLTVREAADPNVTVIVFFNRSFTPEHEAVLPATKPAANQLRVTWTPGSLEPPYARNGALFDVENGYWYEITKVEDGTGWAVLTLNKSLIEDTSSVVIPQGVVDFYPLGPKSRTP